MKLGTLRMPKVSLPKSIIDSNMPKTNFIKNLKENEIFVASANAGLIWLANFVVSEMVISGGIYERSLYLVALNAIIVFTLIQYFPKKITNRAKDKLKLAVVYFITFVVLDYLLIFWLLESQKSNFFQFWGTWLVYAIVILALFTKGKKIKFSRISWRKNREDQNIPEFQSLDKR